jgi:hypothetical protein
MRFMLLVYPEGFDTAAPDFAPPPEAVAAMMKFNEELAAAGVLLSLDGLHPSSKGARVTWNDQGKPIVMDGPFTETREIIGGFWMLQVKSREEAIEWAKRVPSEDARRIELRQVFEMTEFPADVQKVADSPTVRAAVEKQTRA